MQQSSATLKNQDVGIGLWKIVACSQPCLRCFLVSTVFGTVSSLHPTSFLTSIKIIENEVGCRDDTTQIQEGTVRRRIERMQQSSTTPKNQRCRDWVAEYCCILSLLLAVPSCIYSVWHCVIPTSYLFH